MDHDPVVQIVDEIALDAVKYFYFTLGGMPGIREGLAHAVVGDGDGGMAPGNGLLDDAGGVGEGVHIAHLGVEMQLHPLLRIVVLSGLVGDFHDILRAKLHVLAVTAQLQIALYANPHAHGKGAAQGLGLLLLGIEPGGDGAVVVGHVEGEAPQPGAAGFIALHGENLALHHDAAHLQIVALHGDRLGLDLLAHDDIAALGGLLLGGGAEIQAKLLNLVVVHQQVADGGLGGLGDILSGGNLQLHGAAFGVNDAACHPGVVEQQPHLPGRHKALEECKKRFTIAHISFRLSVVYSLSISSMRASTSLSWVTL